MAGLEFGNWAVTLRLLSGAIFQLNSRSRNGVEENDEGDDAHGIRLRDEFGDDFPHKSCWPRNPVVVLQYNCRQIPRRAITSVFAKLHTR